MSLITCAQKASFSSYLSSRDSRGLERQAIKEADDGNLAAALNLLAQAITLTPQRPSIFNNRAQVHRLNSDVVSAMADLDQALQLSQGQGRSACQAFCQRGVYLISDPSFGDLTVTLFFRNDSQT